MEQTKQPHKMRFVLSLLAILMPLGLLAQNINVHGVVKDQTGETVIGATVIEKGTNNGTVTDFDGNFSLSVPANATLSISFIGFATQEIPVAGKTDFSIVLQDDNQILSEVVVVGYGTMRKSDLTGAVGSLGTKDMENTPVANIGQAIQGKIAGLQVIDPAVLDMTMQRTGLTPEKIGTEDGQGKIIKVDMDRQILKSRTGC